MPGAQPRKDLLDHIVSSIIRGSKSVAPGAGKVR
jgi:hypothetical protein